MMRMDRLWLEYGRCLELFRHPTAVATALNKMSRQLDRYCTCSLETLPEIVINQQMQRI
jgi:hypothetical protein